MSHLIAEKLTALTTRIIERAEASGVSLRAFGGVGVRMQCAHLGVRIPSSRQYRPDIDLVAHTDHEESLVSLMRQLGFSRPTTSLFVGGSLLAYQMHVPGMEILEVHVYFGRLRFNHEIPEPYFSAGQGCVDFRALFSTKLFVVRAVHKDLIDLACLLQCLEKRSNEVTFIEVEEYLANACAGGWQGWGRHHTAMRNLTRIGRDRLRSLGFSDIEVETVERGRARALQLLSKGRRGFGWRLASFVRDSLSCRFLWYSEVRPSEAYG